MSAGIDYGAVVADLTRRRDRLTQVIDTLTEFGGQDVVEYLTHKLAPGNGKPTRPKTRRKTRGSRRGRKPRAPRLARAITAPPEDEGPGRGRKRCQECRQSSPAGAKHCQNVNCMVPFR